MTPGTGAIDEYVTLWGAGKRAVRYKLNWTGTSSFVFQTDILNVWFGGKPLKLGAETNVVVDRLGSVRRSAKDYFPYGEEKPATAGDREKYATYLHDAQTNLAYADQRYYATGAGRFMTADPAGSGLNWYSYVGGDPVNGSDPRGLSTILLVPDLTQPGVTISVTFYYSFPAYDPYPSALVSSSGSAGALPATQADYESGGCYDPEYDLPCYAADSQRRQGIPPPSRSAAQPVVPSSGASASASAQPISLGGLPDLSSGSAPPALLGSSTVASSSPSRPEYQSLSPQFTIAPYVSYNLPVITIPRTPFTIGIDFQFTAYPTSGQFGLSVGPYFGTSGPSLGAIVGHDNPGGLPSLQEGWGYGQTVNPGAIGWSSGSSGLPHSQRPTYQGINISSPGFGLSYTYTWLFDWR